MEPSEHRVTEDSLGRLSTVKPWMGTCHAAPSIPRDNHLSGMPLLSPAYLAPTLYLARVVQEVANDQDVLQ
jgi:hypothetical protein